MEAYTGLYYKQNGQLSYSHQSENFLADRYFQGMDLNWGQGARTCISWLHLRVNNPPFFFPELSSNGTKRHGINFQIILSFWKTPSVNQTANWYNSSVILRTRNEFVLHVLIFYVLTSSRRLGPESLKILDLQHNFSHLPNTY